ncbi:MAG: hypothetical protein JSV10_01135 [Candidatus Zixiibacteriota bacterium]|nr:MAG: hypothetical protein JSV10_01135 [candidate division Zixibacteria bacterium]
MTRALLVTCLLALAVPAVAAGDRYDPMKAGHPLRIAAYILHPVGVMLDRLIFRPAWELSQKEGIRQLVGAERPEPITEESANPFLEPYSEEP